MHQVVEGMETPAERQWVGSSLDPLAALAAAPTCAAAQADGVPCEEMGRDCERCPAFLQHRDRMRAREGPL